MCCKQHLIIYSCAIFLGGLAVQSRADIFVEDLGNFPDAIEVSAEFGTFVGLNINGVTINDTGFHFTLANTSYGDGLHSSFDNNPDDSFSGPDGNLDPAMALLIDQAQPFGIYTFGAELPDGSGAFTSGPAGWMMSDSMQHNGFREFNFGVDLDTPPIDGLLFDSAATGILPSLFTNPLTGTIDFFISTPGGFTLGDLLLEDGLPSLEIATEMTWADNGAVQTEFLPLLQGLRPRGELITPLPSAALMGALGLGLAGLLGRRARLSNRSRG
ncbi:MAG: hypothetical protein ACE5E5_15830 [Phycisphaerae bacterium]